RRLRSIPSAGGRFGSLAFSPDGKTLAVVETYPYSPFPREHSGSHIRLWDLAGGGRRCTLPGHENAVESLSLTADGKSLASGDAEGRLLLWDLRTGRPLGQLDLPQRRPQPQVYSAGPFAPDGRVLHVSTRNEHFTWDLAAGKILPGGRAFARDL